MCFSTRRSFLKYFRLKGVHINVYLDCPYKTISLSVVLYGCEACTVILRVFENRVLWRIFGPKRKWRDAGEDCIMRRFITCTVRQISLR
jgi:hypothetical protein